MRLLKSAELKRMAWKNGGGETVEVFVHPPGAGLSDFDWRVSMAHVATDGPFSCFEGIDRTLALLEGEGMRLAIAGQGEVLLTPASPPLSFPADAPTQAALSGGPITDLNVMTRRGVFRHQVERLALDAGQSLHLPPRPAHWWLLLVTGPCRIEASGESVSLAVHDSLMGEGALPTLAIHSAETPVTLFAITIAP
ncbi:HutD/Ves family protein [Aureimonas sp. N4]|uniref:HutD/Ves family protein n=1 Tax=Aureimonas sp. N4 TaxID=1638165 RepID=UPI0007826568|nr:HutD family protein [Aureimonas sp. N4]